jgi:hypothetical protein
MNTPNQKGQLFAQCAAAFGIIAPIIACGILMLPNFFPSLSKGAGGWAGIISIFFIFCLLGLPILGICLSITALVAKKKHGLNGITGLAVTGIVFSGGFFLVLIAFVVASANHQ